jgi:hypothetical protein
MTQLAHAKHYPPSSAKRWLSCPASVNVVGLYHNGESDSSIRGTQAHMLLETALTWGVVPDFHDIDMVYRVQKAYDYIKTLKAVYPDGQFFYEVRIDIPETGEFGTADVVIVTRDTIHVIDYKDGWVPVNANFNSQMMTYLLGLIAKYGKRHKYVLTIIQPNYTHKDGAIRHYEPTQSTMDWFREEVQKAVASDHFTAGKHCRETYCPHRGSCAAFLAWAPENLQYAWYPSDVNGMTDDQLAEALDAADVLQGYRDQLRGEALRRMTRQDRTIRGYDVKRGRGKRAWASEAIAARVLDAMRALGAKEDDLYEKTALSVAGVERWFKRRFRNSTDPGMWQDEFWKVTEGCITGGEHGLTVERDIDGRKSFKRGSEFSPLKEKEPENNLLTVPKAISIL